MKQRTNIKLVEEYNEWLKTINYSKSKQVDYPSRVRRMFEYLEERNINRLDQIRKEHLTDYKIYIEQMTSPLTGRNFSQKYINTHLGAVRNFNKFIGLTKSKMLPIEHLRNNKIQQSEKEVLSQEEIEHLFKLTEGKNKYRLRQRAMLAVYYGLGLRRSEGESLYVKDIDFTRSYVHVRKGKGNKERIVPMSNGVKNHLKEYVKESRPLFTRGKYVRSFFVSNTGNPLDAQTLFSSLKDLLEQSTLKSIKEKTHKIGLHSLRHSIATHLMENGMDFESISYFLGHSSLESTQIYTHIDERTIK